MLRPSGLVLMNGMVTSSEAPKARGNGTVEIGFDEPESWTGRLGPRYASERQRVRPAEQFVLLRFGDAERVADFIEELPVAQEAGAGRQMLVGEIAHIAVLQGLNGIEHRLVHGRRPIRRSFEDEA